MPEMDEFPATVPRAATCDCSALLVLSRLDMVLWRELMLEPLGLAVGPTALR
jgi:hypothetical protein